MYQWEKVDTFMVIYYIYGRHIRAITIGVPFSFSVIQNVVIWYWMNEYQSENWAKVKGENKIDIALKNSVKSAVQN